jgi:hypothetical protein
MQAADGARARESAIVVRGRCNNHPYGEYTDGGGYRKSKGEATPQRLQAATPCCDKIQQGKTDACRSRIAV